MEVLLHKEKREIHVCVIIIRPGLPRQGCEDLITINLFVFKIEGKYKLPSNCY